ncbi:MAG TPA: hypothetical protein VMW47_10615 [Verrucomicrobiae bacterium]|nr:hypothetical protein [Verrucomicrobiae bacterium]
MTISVPPPAPTHASGRYQAVNEALWLDRAATRRRAAERAEQRAALSTVDGILSDLERLRLAGHETLPLDARRRVERTLIGLQRAGAPMGRRRPPVRGTIRRLSNRLFALEAEMLSPSRSGPEPQPVPPRP